MARCVRHVVAAAAVAAGATAAGAARPARAEVGGSVSVGGGVRGGAAVSAAEARADWAEDGVAVGLGVRVRMMGDRLVTADWDGAGDWLAILRYVEVRRTGRRGAVEVVAGQTPSVSIGDGAIVDGVIAAALVDRRATGVHARAETARLGVEVAIDDVLAPTVIGARGAWRPAGRGELAAEVAVDPDAPSAMGAHPVAVAALDGAWSVTHGQVRDRADAGAGLSPGGGAGAWLGLAVAADLGAVRFALRGEVTAGSRRWVPARFGPLYAVERALPGAALDDLARAGGHAGVGGAVRLDLTAGGDADAPAFDATVAMRARPGLGGELDGRIAAPAWRSVVAAARVAAAPSRRLWILGAELRAGVGRGVYVAGEAARQYDLAGPMARAAWQATAWVGVAAAR